MMHILNHILRAGVFLVVLGACAEPTHINGSCNVSADCHTRENRHAIGSICNEAILRCECPQGSVTCCPDGVLPGTCAATCSPSQACSALPGFAADAGSDASAEDAAGPDADAGPAPECEHDAQCPDAPSRECGEGRCVDGRCELEIIAGPIASQKYGDCKLRRCTELGNLEEVIDANDTYNDMNDCTGDWCRNEGPVHEWEWDGTPCNANSGYCYQGACVECIEKQATASCQTNGFVCDFFLCVPFDACSNGECGGVCAPCDLGGPCTVDGDCISNACIGSKCEFPTCQDSRRSGAETGLDCGGPSCPPCPHEEACTWPTDCLSGVCMYGTCKAPTCLDGIHNGDEGGVDCGDPCPECL